MTLTQQIKRSPWYFMVTFLLLIIALFHCNEAFSSQGVVPLNVTVYGKLVITDASSDLTTSGNETLNLNLQLLPEPNSSVLSGKSSIRIRTNLNTWKLSAQRNDISQLQEINPKDISLSFHTSAGSKANPNAAKLASLFNNKVTNLSDISSTSSTDILIGNSKTSVAKDRKNHENWFQLTSVCKTKPANLLEYANEWSTVISYSLISP